MSEHVNPTSALSDWPVFEIQHTFNPDDIAPMTTFEPNEVVLYDAMEYRAGRWISAKYGSYVPITDVC